MHFTLTRRCEYGIRMLLHLTGRGPGARTTTTEIAAMCDIPAGNIAPIVSELRRGGFLTCTPGRGGGCSLARPPEEVSLLDVIEALEGKIDTGRCLLDSRRCQDKDAECALHATWTAAKQEAITALAGLSLAEAARREKEIALAPRVTGSG